jgi:hypothetical protein
MPLDPVAPAAMPGGRCERLARHAHRGEIRVHTGSEVDMPHDHAFGNIDDARNYLALHGIDCAGRIIEPGKRRMGAAVTTEYAALAILMAAAANAVAKCAVAAFFGGARFAAPLAVTAVLGAFAAGAVVFLR